MVIIMYYYEYIVPLKGTMSHLQAKKTKMLNSNDIWKIILI